MIERYSGHAGVVSAIAYHPFGRLFFSGDWSGLLNAWQPYDADAYEGRYDENLFAPMFLADVPVMEAGPRQPERIERMVISRDGKTMAVGLQTGLLQVWKLRGFKKVAEMQAHEGLLYGLAIGPSGERIATVARDGMIKTWILKRKQQREKAFELTGEGQAQVQGARLLQFLDDRRIMVGTADGRVMVVAPGQTAAEQVR